MRAARFLLAGIMTAPLPALADTIEDSAAYAHFQAAFADLCFWDETPAAAEYFPSESWPLTWDTPYSDTPETATLYKFFCGAGAYNVNHVFYLDREFEGPLPVPFAVPAFEIAYENDDFDGAVEDIAVTGFTTRFLLTNAEFDPQDRTVFNHSLWRGIGDASSGGVWAFGDGDFVLKSYDVDASYDGEINPIRIVDFE